jgi:hypothetical protein
MGDTGRKPEDFGIVERGGHGCDVEWESDHRQPSQGIISRRRSHVGIAGPTA